MLLGKHYCSYSIDKLTYKKIENRKKIRNKALPKRILKVNQYYHSITNVLMTRVTNTNLPIDCIFKNVEKDDIKHKNLNTQLYFNISYESKYRTSNSATPYSNILSIVNRVKDSCTHLQKIIEVSENMKTNKIVVEIMLDYDDKVEWLAGTSTIYGNMNDTFIYKIQIYINMAFIALVLKDQSIILHELYHGLGFDFKPEKITYGGFLNSKNKQFRNMLSELYKLDELKIRKGLKKILKKNIGLAMETGLSTGIGTCFSHLDERKYSSIFFIHKNCLYYASIPSPKLCLMTGYYNKGCRETKLDMYTLKVLGGWELASGWENYANDYNYELHKKKGVELKINVIKVFTFKNLPTVTISYLYSLYYKYII